ncbi:MAG: DUF3566 domain-containing protein [Nocardioidaceae bacterium]
MNDRRPDDSSPLAPHRPLTGPARQSASTWAQAQRPASTDAGGPPTAAMPRVTTPPAAPGRAGRGNHQQTSAAQSAVTASTAAPPRPAASGQSPTVPTATGAAPTASSTVAGAKAKKTPVRTRRARLRIVRVDPWSVMKIAFAVSIALAIVTVVAVVIVWSVLGTAGVWDSINSSVASVMQNDAKGFDVTNYVGLGRVMGLTIIVAAVDVVLITAIATLGAFLYNLTASLLGGLEITLAEDV